MAVTREVDIQLRAIDRASAGFGRVIAAASRMRGRLHRQGAGIQSAFAGFGQSMQSSMLGAIAKLGALVVALKAVKAATLDYIGGGIRSLGQMERMQVTLATTTRDLGKAQELLEQATKFAAETPFEIPEIVEATVKLETYGLKSQEVLRVVGDMAAVTGKPLMQAVEAMADAQTGELERLKEFGITKRQLIEAGAAVNAQGTIEDMKSLNDALMSVMEARFGGGMKMMGQTFEGIVSNLKDAWGTLQRDLAQPSFEVVRNGLRDLLAWINRLKEDGSLQEWTDRVGQGIARIIKILISFPQIFSLVGKSFVEFLKAFGNWEFVEKSFIRVGKFLIDTFSAALRLMVQLVESVAKVIWIPLVRSFVEVFIVGIKNVWDQVGTVLTLPKAVIMGEVEKTLNDLRDRTIKRLDDIESVWDETWSHAGSQFSVEMANVMHESQRAFAAIKKSGEENLLPIFREGIGDELNAQWKELVETINQDVIPSQMKFNLTQQDAIKMGNDLAKVSKAEVVGFVKGTKEKEQAEQRFNARLIELTLGETALRTAELRNQRNRYLELGLDRIQVERLYQAELKSLNQERTQQTQDVNNEISRFLMGETEFRFAEIERQKQAYLQQGADRVAVEQWASLQRISIQQEADAEIRQEGLFTIQTLTAQWGRFLDFARRGFRILAGQSNETWQMMVADIIEWGAGLVAQYLIARGLEQLRRVEGIKTHARFMRDHAEEMLALSAKLALIGDFGRAAAAAAAAGVSLARSVMLEKEAMAMNSAAKASIGLGLAVQAGGAIASEALQQWGNRAQEARQAQEALNQAPGLNAPSISGQALPEPLTAIPTQPVTQALPAAPAATTGNPITFIQNNHFEGLVNFDNEEALRELARKLRPFTDEFAETFTTA